MAGARKAGPLKDGYDAAGTLASPESYFAGWAAKSERTRATLRCELDVAYGAGERERLDLFPAPGPDAPCFIWIHGGYWRRLDKSFYSFVVEPAVAAGAAAAVLNYPLVATATLDEIVEAVRRAFVWIARNAARLKADPQRFVVGGHSAGGHLAGMLAATDWAARDLAADSIQGVFSLSGLFDLEPVRLSHVNEWLKLDAESARRNSPLLHLPKRSIPLLAAAGGGETAEFRRQSRDYAGAWSHLGYPAQYLEVADRNHFSVVDELARPGTDLQATLSRLL